MKVSLNWVKQYLNFDLPAVDELAAKIGAQLGAIEEIDNLGAKYQGVVVARIVSCVDHPNADRLHVCMIDDGGAVKDVARDEQGHVQVVCGAPNAREGIMVAWLPPKTTVPETFGKEPFVLEARELRGVMSNGMLASARELALGTDHSGIVEIDADAHPGDDFAKFYGLDDQIIDIENKMFTHRPDCFGELGVAREIAGILHRPFASPDWYKLPSPDVLPKSGESLPIAVQNELPALVPRFMAVAFHIEHLGPSPLWLQTYLSRVGLRPINNVVDITNYLMLLTGQPLHAYDYDKVRALSGNDAATLVVRYPHDGEKLTLLNGKEITPRSEAIMIATDKQAIGLGGVMGGGETEVDEHTQNVLLECATFDMYSIRRTSMAHGLFTDAVTRFNKGQSPLQNNRITGYALKLYGELCGAKQASDIIDDNHVDGREWIHPPVPVSATYINTRLGLKLTAEEMKQLLENVEFKVGLAGASSPRRRGSSEDDIADGDASADWIPDQVGNDGAVLTVTAPFWRTDIELREDVVEEVGRLFGFDHLPLELPQRVIEPTQKDELLELKSRIRAQLSRSGANEVLTYSFVHGNLLEKVGQDKSHAFQLSNAISPDLQYYRLSLTPSLLEKVHPNIKAGYDEFALFEIGKIHSIAACDEVGLPVESEHVAFVYSAAKPQKPGAAYYEARAFLDQLTRASGLDLDVEIVPNIEGNTSLESPFDPTRSATLQLPGSGEKVGVIGEFKASVRQKLKLPEHTAGFELDLRAFQKGSNRYVPLPRFPKVTQDICLKVSTSTPYSHVYGLMSGTVAKNHPSNTVSSVEPIDIYQREDDKDHKQITLRLSIASYEKTLTDEEVAKLLDDVAHEAADKLGAERI